MAVLPCGLSFLKPAEGAGVAGATGSLQGCGANLLTSRLGAGGRVENQGKLGEEGEERVRGALARMVFRAGLGVEGRTGAWQQRTWSGNGEESPGVLGAS